MQFTTRGNELSDPRYITGVQLFDVRAETAGVAVALARDYIVSERSLAYDTDGRMRAFSPVCIIEGGRYDGGDELVRIDA